MKTVVLSITLLILLLFGSQFGTFGDEVDNYLGGKIISQGGTLYRDYWSHHMPAAYQLSAVYASAGAKTYLHFRLMWAVTVWLGGMVLYRYLRQRVVLWLLLLMAVCGITLQTNMLIAESIVGLLALAALLCLRYPSRHTPHIVVLLAWLITVTSLKHVYLAALLVVVAVRVYRRERTRCIASLALPALLTIGYLAVYRNGAELVHWAYQFNADHYAPFTTYSGAVTPTHPAAVLVITVHHFILAQIGLLTGQTAPYASLIVFAAALTIYWCFRRRWLDALLIIGLVILSYPTNHPYYIPGAHFTAHYTVLVGAAGYAVWLTWQSKARLLWRAIVLLALLVCITAEALPAALVRVDTPPRYAELINAMVPPGASVFLAPAEFQDWLEIDRYNAAAPYYFYYPWLADDPVIRVDLLARLKAHPPWLVVYHRGLSSFPGYDLPAFAPELTAWVDANYDPLPDYPDVYVLR